MTNDGCHGLVRAHAAIQPIRRRAAVVIEQVQGRGRDPPHAVADDVGRALGHLGRVVDHRPDLEEAPDQALLVRRNGRLGRRDREPEGGVDGRQVRPAFAERRPRARRRCGQTGRAAPTSPPRGRSGAAGSRIAHSMSSGVIPPSRSAWASRTRGTSTATKRPSASAHEDAGGDQLVDLRGLDVRLAGELGLGQEARLGVHVPNHGCQPAVRCLARVSATRSCASASRGLTIASNVSSLGLRIETQCCWAYTGCGSRRSNAA